jgi:hypothetical protein
MISAYDVILEAKDLGITLTANGDHLDIEAPRGAMTLELMRSLKEHKAMILYILALPEPAKPGAEVEQLRREIGEMVRTQTDRMEVQA